MVLIKYTNKKMRTTLTHILNEVGHIHKINPYEEVYTCLDKKYSKTVLTKYDIAPLLIKHNAIGWRKEKRKYLFFVHGNEEIYNLSHRVMNALKAQNAKQPQ